MFCILGILYETCHSVKDILGDMSEQKILSTHCWEYFILIIKSEMPCLKYNTCFCEKIALRQVRLSIK